MGNQSSTGNAVKKASTENSITMSEKTETQCPIMRILQNFLLFWLDSNIDVSNEDFKKSLTQLRRIVTTIRTHTNVQECMREMKQFDKEKIFLIVSGTLSQTILPEIQKWPQIDSVYIFCNNKSFHQDSVMTFSIVKGIHNDIGAICEALKTDRERCDRTMVSISYRGIDPLFMYTQLIKEAILQIEDDDATSIKALADYCRSQKDIPESEIQLIELEYDLHKPVWWYTAPYFIYFVLNRGLRVFDIDILLKMGFFMRHLCHHIEELHREQQQPSSSAKMAGKPEFEVFRGQGLSKLDFEKLIKTKGGLMSFNNFLSTSYDRDVSLQGFARPAAFNAESVGILFIMKINSQLCMKSSIPFVEISGDIGYFEDREAEILFSTHTIFRIDEIQRMPDPDTDRLYQVNLTLTSPDNHELKDFAKKMRDEIGGREGQSRLAYLLMRAGQIEEALRLYHILLEQSTVENEKAEYNYDLGCLYYSRHDNATAISYYEKFLELRKKNLSLDDLDLAGAYNNIGLVYDNMGEYSKALSSYSQAIEIKKKKAPLNHDELASSYGNMGTIYVKIAKYSEALSYYEKSLEIYKQFLPEIHPTFASCYGNLANLYFRMKDYSKALSFFEKALEIQKQTLPPNHPQLTSTHTNIGNVYLFMGEYSKAQSSFQQVLEMQQNVVPPNQSDLADTYTNLGNLCKCTGDYAKALEYHKQAFEIYKIIHPANHLVLAESYGNIGFVYENMHNYSLAYEYLKQSLGIFKKSLPPGHPHIQIIIKSIELLKTKV